SSCTASGGNGRRARTRPTPAIARSPARSASTMESSCAISSSCVVPRWRHRRGTRATPIATSSHRIRAGNFQAFGWRRTHERKSMPNALPLYEEERWTLVEADKGLPSDFAADVRDGLTARNKRLSCRYFYDAEGSALFEEICALPEYYLTRAEQEILDAHAGAIVAAATPEAALVELGSGSATKTRTIIEAALAARGRGDTMVRYVPIDISRSMLLESSRALLEDYAAVEITAIAAEYRAGLRWLERQREPKLILWLGSNVGNFARPEAARFLRGVRATMTARDRLLMGVDLRKGRAVLEAAYDDAAGVTARFS